MKRRRLDSVMRYRQQVEKLLSAELSDLERELRHGEWQVLERHQLLDTTHAQYRNDQRTEICHDGFELDAQHFYAFTTRLAFDIKMLQVHADTVRERYEAKREEWAAAARDRKAVEILDEKQKNEERAWMAKYEDQHLDEVAQRQHYHDTLMQ